MKPVIFALFFLLGIILEGTIWQLPITLCLLLIFFIFTKKASVFPLAFIAGLTLDVFRVDPIGLRSIFLILFLFLVALYERKFEIRSLPFVLTASVLGSSLYLLFFN